MNFFEAQEQARKRSLLLVVLFGAAVVAIIATVYVIAHFALLGPEAGLFLDPVLLAYVAIGVGLLVGLGSAFRSSQLRQGGAAVAKMLGGRQVDPNTTEPNERRLIHVVEEMAIASGTPVPEIFVLDHEPGINAFAAGYHTHDAAIAVTRGTLEKLNRQELQGVIAHEFSHVLNGDMRMNIRLIGLLFGILLLAVVGRMMLYTRPRASSRQGGGGLVMLLGLGLILVGYIGVFFGKLIKAAVSRQREFLADAAAVQFTRDPQGIAGALKKIGGEAYGSRIQDPHAEEASHLFFANGLRPAHFSFTATHPPLAARIRRLDPSWDGEYVVPETVEARAEPPRERLRTRARGARPEEAAAAATGVFPGPAGSGPMAAAALLSSIGTPTVEHVSYAERLLDTVPDQLRAAAHDPTGAQALIFAMLLADDERVRSEQGRLIRGYAAYDMDRTEGLAAQLREQSAAVRLPLIDMALPILKRMSPDRSTEFQRVVRQLILADGHVRMFDYTLVNILARHLPGPAQPPVEPARTIHSFGPIRDDVEAVLSAVARSSATDEAEIRAAFGAGAKRLPPGAGRLQLQPERETGLDRIDQALGRIEDASLKVRRQFLDACAHTVVYDGKVRLAEAEMLRAISEALDCPMPPILGQG